MRQEETEADQGVSYLQDAVLAGLLVAVFLAAAFASHELWGLQ